MKKSEAVHVHLIDGTYELFRAFYGPPGSVHEGREVGATRAFFRSMASLLREPKVTHIAAAFDTEIECFRNLLFDGYKTGEGIDEELHAQFPWVETAARALGITVWSMIDFEADDGLATGAATYTKDPSVAHIWLCSPDKDLYQCVDDKVRVLDRMRKKVFDTEAVQEKFGIRPEQVPDYLGLVGDTADGIPGIPRWGAKSTAAVLSRYGSLEEIPTSADDWDIKVRGAKALAENLAAEHDEALLYKKLAILRADASPTSPLSDLRWTSIDEKALAEYVELTGDARAEEIAAGVTKAMTGK